MPKTSIKIAYHESNAVPTSSATSLIVIQRLSKIIFFTASMFSLVVHAHFQRKMAKLCLWKLNVANIIVFNFYEQKFVQHGPITIPMVCNGISLLIFECPIMPQDQIPHQTVTCFECVDFSMYACRFSVPQMRQFCLFTYPPRSK